MVQSHSKQKCPCGTDRSLWGSSLSKERPGFVRTECTRCGKFIGYCPEAVLNKKKKNKGRKCDE